MKSIRDFGVLPGNEPELNSTNLQEAIDWAALRGAALHVDPDEGPYRLTGGIVAKMNATLIGPHAPVGAGTQHPNKARPRVRASDRRGEQKATPTADHT